MRKREADMLPWLFWALRGELLAELAKDEPTKGTSERRQKLVSIRCGVARCSREYGSVYSTARDGLPGYEGDTFVVHWNRTAPCRHSSPVQVDFDELAVFVMDGLDLPIAASPTTYRLPRSSVRPSNFGGDLEVEIPRNRKEGAEVARRWRSDALASSQE